MKDIAYYSLIKLMSFFITIRLFAEMFIIFDR